MNPDRADLPSGKPALLAVDAARRRVFFTSQVGARRFGRAAAGHVARSARAHARGVAALPQLISCLAPAPLSASPTVAAQAEADDGSAGYVIRVCGLDAPPPGGDGGPPPGSALDAPVLTRVGGQAMGLALSKDGASPCRRAVTHRRGAAGRRSGVGQDWTETHETSRSERRLFRATPLRPRLAHSRKPFGGRGETPSVFSVAPPTLSSLSHPPPETPSVFSVASPA